MKRDPRPHDEASSKRTTVAQVIANNDSVAAGGNIINSALGPNSRVIKVQVGGLAFLVTVVLLLVLNTSSPPEIEVQSADGALEAAPRTTYDWVADCARRHVMRPVELIDPAEEATLEVEDTVAVVADDVWLDISVMPEDGVDLELAQIRIEEVGRESKPSTGIFLNPTSDAGCAEGFASYAWEVALDEDAPGLSPRDLREESDGSVTRILFPYPIPSSGDTLRLYFASHGCECRFRVVLDWLRNGQPTEPTMLPDNGRRFHVVPDTDLADYRIAQTSEDMPVIEPVP